MYKKRANLHSIQGQLYETKLLSLILFRAQHNNDIEEFYMGSQIENAHHFDDICFKAKIKGYDQPLVVFMQVRHKEIDRNPILSHIDIVKFFKSYLNIQQSFNPKSNDIFFNEYFDNTECLCIFYTNAKCDFKRDDLNSPFATHLVQLIGTSMVGGSQLSNAEENVQILETELLKHEIKILARQFAKYITNKRNEMMMKDEYIMRYHVILARNVLHILKSDLETNREHYEKYNICSFRHDFFETSDKYLSLFKEELYQNVFESLQSKYNPAQNSHVHDFLSFQSEETLINVMGSHITYKNNKLKFIENVSDDLKQKLSLINSRMSRSTIKNAINTVTRNMLQALEFKVPFAFGNTDLVLGGSSKKVKKRLDFLAQSIVDLIEKSKPNYIVYIDETIPIGLLRLNGGLAGAVGNLLVCDDESGLLKFADDCSLLEPNAKCLLTKLKEKVYDLQNYRVQVNIMKFPKLTVRDHYNKLLVQKFLSKLMLWTEQASYKGLIKILIEEIENREYAKTDYFRIKSDAILLQYHASIQNWWMSPETQYLTKERNMYQLAVEDISKNQLIWITSMMYMKKITSAEYSFKEEALDLFSSDFSKTKQIFVVTNITILTVIKVIQCLSKMEIYDPIVLDLKYVSEMLTDEFHALLSELKRKLKQFLILICDDLSTLPNFNIKLQNLIQEISDKEVVIIINNTDRTMMRQSFPQISKIIYDDKNYNFEDIGASSQSQFQSLNVTSAALVDGLPMKMKQSFPEMPIIIYDRNHNMEDLNTSSQSRILNNAKVSFQGENVTLSDLVDDLPMKFIQGSVLRKVILNENIMIGGSLTNSYYDKKQHLFVERKVIRDDVPLELHTLSDIKDDIVIVTGKPGIGKSTLFTHLAVKTKKLNYKLWIVKINFLDCVKYFNKWHKHKTIVSTLEMFKLMCHVVLQSIRPGCDAKINLQIEENGDVCLLDLGVDDEWATFELRLFLHFYMRQNVIFLFDGFDEISPYYTETVVAFLKVIKDDIHKNRLWITSRSCKEINTLIESRFGKAYELQCFDENELLVFLDKFWKTNLLLSNFDKERIEKLKEFLDTTELHLTKHSLTILNYPLSCVFVSLILYLVTNFPDADGRDKWRVLYEKISDTLKQMSVHEDETSESSENLLNVKIPLLAYLSAKYFSNYIKHSEDETYEKLYDKICLANIYEQFVKTKVLNHFLNNKKVDIYNPSIRMEYEEELQKLMKVYTNS